MSRYYPRGKNADGSVIFSEKMSSAAAIACIESWEKSHKQILQDKYVVIKDDDGYERIAQVKVKYYLEDENGLPI